MHELSIAEAVFEIASRHAAGRRVAVVELQVGHLRQVVPSALHFAFELVAADSPLAGARLEIEDVPVRGICRGCGAEGALPELPLACGRCGGLDVDVTQGEELLVAALELEEDLVTSGG